VTLHIHRVPTHVVSRRTLPGQRWCFVCRKRVDFTMTIHAPDDPVSYYGPHASIECEHGHSDGDIFPGRIREWDEGF
jgi:hypothetical protein